MDIPLIYTGRKPLRIPERIEHPEIEYCEHCQESGRLHDEIYNICGIYLCWSCMQLIKEWHLKGRTDFKDEVPAELYEAIIKNLNLKL